MFGLLELALASSLAAVGFAPSPAGTGGGGARPTHISAGPSVPRPAQSPSDASSSASGTGPLSGYMELHLNHPTDGTPAVLDFHRFVLLFSHSFSDRLRFVGELEVEHAVVEGL